MSQLDVQNILEGIRIGHQRQVAQQQNQIAQQQLSDQQKAEQDRVDDFHAQLDQEHQQFTATQAAQLASRKVALLFAKQKLAEHPELLDSMGTKTGSVTDPQGNTNVSYNIPELQNPDNPTGSFTTPDQMTQAKAAGAADAQINAPKYAQQTAMAQMQQAAALQREHEMTQERLIAAESHNDMMRMVASIGASSREKVAGVDPNSTENEDNSDVLKGLLDGSQSAQDVNKMFSGTKASKARAMRIMSQSLQNRVIPPPDTVKNGLNSVASGMSIMPLYDQLISGKDENGKDLSLLDKNRIVNEIQGQVGNLTKGLDGMSGQRLNVPVLQKTISAYLPGKMATLFGMTDQIKGQRDNLLRTISNQIDSSLASYPPGQRAAMKQRVLGSKYYSELTPNAQAAPQPPSAGGNPDFTKMSAQDMLNDIGAH